MMGGHLIIAITLSCRTRPVCAIEMYHTSTALDLEAILMVVVLPQILYCTFITVNGI